MARTRTRGKWLGATAGLLAAIQLVPIERDNPPVDSDLPAPPAIGAILKRSCYDCHSHETRWPWYGQVAPVSWLLSYDVSQARSELNFSTWKAYRPDERRRLLRDALEQIEERSMPPWEYLLMHEEARMDERDRAILRDWIAQAEG